MDPDGKWTSTRAVLLAAAGQNCWPPAGSYMAATGQDLMAADTRQEQIALWLFLGAWATATWLSLLPVIAVVQVVAWAAGGAGLVLFAVQSIRLSRAWTARAGVESAVEEAEAMARIRRRAS